MCKHTFIKGCQTFQQNLSSLPFSLSSLPPPVFFSPSPSSPSNTSLVFLLMWLLCINLCAAVIEQIIPRARNGLPNHLSAVCFPSKLPSLYAPTKMWGVSGAKEKKKPWGTPPYVANHSRTGFQAPPLHQPQALCGLLVHAGDFRRAMQPQRIRLSLYIWQRVWKTFPRGGETSGIFGKKQNSFHIVRSDLCYVKINLRSQLLVRALGLFYMYCFHKDVFIVNQRGAMDLTLLQWSTGFAAIHLPRGKQNSGSICHS